MVASGTALHNMKEIERRLIGRFRSCKGELKDRGEQMAKHLAQELGQGICMTLEQKTKIVSQLLCVYMESDKIWVSGKSLCMKQEVMYTTINDRSVRSSSTKPRKAHRGHRMMPNIAAGRF